MKPIIQLEKICKNYGSFQAVCDLDLSIQKGQCFGLLGTNGAGKSTTIRMITGQLRKTAGHLDVMGFDPGLEPKRVHENIGYIPDSQSLYDDLSVFQNILLFARLFGKGAEDVDKIIAEVDLLAKKNTAVKKLSKGLRQRVVIARALVHKPKIILLDEPTSGLDPKSADVIYRILESLKDQGATLLLTTHLMNDVERLCDEIVFIHEGKKIEQGSPFSLKNKYSSSMVEVISKTAGGVSRHQFQMSGQLNIELAQIEADSEILSIHSLEPKLEEIFIQLVGET